MLSNAEIIAILLGSGSRDKSALDLAREILAHCNNDLEKLGKYSVTDFIQFKGIGSAKAITLISALELGRRRKAAEPEKLPTIKSSSDAYAHLLPLFEDLPHEEFYVLLLNRANRITDTIKISSGGVSGTVADIRMMVKPALLALASGVILAHNHPSGNLKPSEADLSLTRKTKDALKLFDIALLDHLIVTDAGYLSMADEALL